MSLHVPLGSGKIKLQNWKNLAFMFVNQLIRLKSPYIIYIILYVYMYMYVYILFCAKCLTYVYFTFMSYMREFFTLRSPLFD